MDIKEVKHIKGNISMQDDYMDFINYVFGFNGAQQDFYKLLPKLYKPEFDPCASSYVTLEDDRIKAAVGAFDLDLRVCGEQIKCRGIGNVAVHPFSRSKGYMKKLMQMSIDDMLADGVELSVLGGRRQRYNYFSFEKCGPSYSFTVNADNMRHVFGKERTHRFELRRLTPDDKASLAAIARLSNDSPCHIERDESKLYDILTSWFAVPLVAYDKDGNFAGYAIANKKDSISEVRTVRESDLTDMIICIYDMMGQPAISITLPPFRAEAVETLLGFCEGYQGGINELYSVLNYQKVCSAFMKLKTTYEPLPDGELVLDIEGRAGREKLLFAVKNGVPSVTPTERDADFALTHLEAMSVIFGGIAPRRNLPAFARVWFPLPIWVYNADMV